MLSGGKGTDRDSKMGSNMSERPTQIDEEDEDERSETSSEINARVEKEKEIQDERRRTKEKFELLKDYQRVFDMKPKTMEDIL